MRYLSLFSGIEAATVAWVPLGWQAAAFAEVDPFACAVLKHHYPDVPNLGDVTKMSEEKIRHLGHIDIVVFGFPCQDLSVAGKRAGLKGERSGLFFTAMRIVRWSRARFALFENVPGLFSSEQGRDFAAVAGEMVGVEFDVPESGWRNSGVAVGPAGLLEWTVLDAQWFGVPQRRRRIFAIADFGDWASRQPILLELESMCGNPPTRQETGSRVAALTSTGVGTCGADDNQAQAGHLIPSTGDVSHCLNAGGMHRIDYETETLVAHSLRAEGFDASEDGTGRGIPLVASTLKSSNGGGGFGSDPNKTFIPVAFSCKDSGADASEVAPTLRSMNFDKSHANAGGQIAVGFLHCNKGRPNGRQSKHTEMVTVEEIVPTLATDGHAQSAIAFNLRGREDGAQAELSDVASLRSASGGSSRSYVATSAVRRLTPEECEALQGFPRRYTKVPYRGKPAADGPRYKALGNSFAVPVVRWIGQRIQQVIESQR